MPALKRIVVASMLVAVALPATADAKPRMTTQTLIQGEESNLVGHGCESATYWVNYRGRGRDLESYRPTEGAQLAGPSGYYSSRPRYKLNVTRVTEGNGRITWTIAPDPEECARRGEDWTWRVAKRAWSVEYKRKVYAIIGIGQTDYRWRTGRGVVNIAGLPVSKLFGGRLNLHTVSRYLGRPKRVVGSRRHTDCVAHWPRIGLKAWFVSFGIAPNCWDRQLQGARISGPALRRWAVVEGDNPGTPGATLPLRWLRGPWAHKWWPYGPVTTQISPAITPRYGGSPRRIKAFDLRIGAAGD